MNLLFTLFVQQQHFANFFMFYFIRENLVKVFYFYKNLFNFFWCFYVFYKKCVFSLVQRFFQYCFNFFWLIFLQITGCVKFAPHKPLKYFFFFWLWICVWRVASSYEHKILGNLSKFLNETIFCWSFDGHKKRLRNWDWRLPISLFVQN